MDMMDKIMSSRWLLLRELDDINNKDLQKCYDILEELLGKQNVKFLEPTLIASFGYALGRRLYMVSEVVENIKK